MQEARREPHTILVIDESPALLDKAGFALERAGFRVVTRDRAAGSVVAILQDRPDLVLIDVTMQSGESMADILSRSGPDRGGLIILHSELPVHVLRAKVVATGAFGFIQKTSAQVDLVRQVRAFLQQAQSNSRMRAAAPSPEEGSSSARIRAALAVSDPMPSSGAGRVVDRVEVSRAGSTPPDSRESRERLPARRPAEGAVPRRRHGGPHRLSTRVQQRGIGR